MYFITLVSLITYLILWIIGYNDINDTLYITSVSLFIFINILYFTKIKKGNLINFEFFFALSFLLSNYLFPLIANDIYGTYMGPIFLRYQSLLSKALILSSLGYYAYMLGLLTYNHKLKRLSVQFTGLYKIKYSTNDSINYLNIFIIILFFISGGIKMYTMYNGFDGVQSERLNGFGVFISYGIILCTLSMITNFSVAYHKSKHRYNIFVKKLPNTFIIVTLFYIVSFLISGYRSNAIQIVLPLLYLYNTTIRKINYKKFSLIILAGVVLLITIGLYRNGDDVETHLGFVDYVRDFIAANSANQFFIYYVDQNGPTYGSNILNQLLSVIPGLQSAMTLFIDSTKLSIASSSLYTNKFGLTWGLGTNVIGDLYYTFGLLGVAGLMYLLGYIIRFLENNFKRNIYYSAWYLLLIGNSIFAARVEFFYILRSLSWIAIFIFIFKHVYNDNMRCIFTNHKNLRLKEYISWTKN